jgi:flagellar protein FliO/FliZ
MMQSLILVALFLCVLVSLPVLIEHLKRRHGQSLPASAGATRLVSTLSLGPQQQVVTLEVGPQGARVCLVLGVTVQSIQCLHTAPVVGLPGGNTLPATTAHGT